MNLSKDQLDLLCGIAEEAGREVMRVYAGEITAHLKEDDSPLTEADLRSDAVIRQGLRHAFGQWPILSEEGSQSLPGGAETFFLVDPLDGTKEFIKRNGEFTVNIALVHQGKPVAGVVGAPALGELFYGARGLGAAKRTPGGEAAVRPAVQRAGPLRVIGSRSHGGEAMERWLAQLAVPHEFVPAGSSLKFCRIAEGAADIYPRLGPTCQWDTAAGQAVLEAAGGCVLDAQGEPLGYGGHRPILNGHFIALAAPGMAFPPLP